MARRETANRVPASSVYREEEAGASARSAFHTTRDPGLEETIGDIMARARRRRHGRIFLVLELLEGRVVRRRVEESGMTREDYDHLMRERPRMRGRGKERL